ncbi:S-layer homology domain-containing protein [Gorillibacterium sp. sgz5001074]|uniref:rhamnogalacturonan lyase family protein n=1 Tax=Gorillibacterium sp. sgz5001074 TaxID=3446695 RepID=UPI003F676446
MGPNKHIRKWLALALTWALVLSNASLVWADSTGTNTGGAAVLQTVTSTDFGDSGTVTPANWGFTTSSATLAIDTATVGTSTYTNSTPKLLFNMSDQKGGRVATKTFSSPIIGAQTLLAFDWYPGKVNDKGSNPSENAGELRISDSSNNVIYTLNNTNNSPLTYFAGKQLPSNTVFTNPQTWYAVQILIDVQNNRVQLTMTDKSNGKTESYTSTLDGVAFDCSVSSVRLAGVRTSGNNITWTTYLDNFSVSTAAIPLSRITQVQQLPYRTVYVQETTTNPASVGLPQTVKVTLADKSTATLGVTWSSVGTPWNPAVPGVYEFRGALTTGGSVENGFGRYATNYVYNRLKPSTLKRQAEWLDRGVVALKADTGIFLSWRLLGDEYARDVRFNVYRNGQLLNTEPLAAGNFLDAAGVAGDRYTVETLVNGTVTERNMMDASDKNYLSIPMQKPAGGTTASGEYSYSVNDGGVADLDGDGQYEVIVKWYPSNAIDSSQSAMTGPTLFDAYKLDGTLLWRMDMGLNLTSGAHYNQFIAADFDGDGKAEFMIKTADATTVYGATGGKVDYSKVMSVIGNPADNGDYLNESGHITGGPEWMSVFNGETGRLIDSVKYAFPLGEVSSWGDTWYNRSDRFLSGLAYLDGVKPSAVFGRGYYQRTTFVAYSLVNGRLVTEWTFDSNTAGRGDGLGFHNLSTGDVDNDGFDEIVAGSLTLDHDGKILYAMDGNQGRVQGSHGDAMHMGAFDPTREGLQVVEVHEEPSVASLEVHDAATGETLQAYYNYVDAGRSLAANIDSKPGHEFWGATKGTTTATGGGIYSVTTGTYSYTSYSTAGVSMNYALYWDGDLLQEMLDNTSITKFNEKTGTTAAVRSFDGVMSSNGTKATPTLQADILGDWREEVLLPTTDSSELRIYSTTLPTDYRLYTLMHDPVYRNGIGWQNSAYNQPPHLGFYLGEDIKAAVLAGQLMTPKVVYQRYTPSSGSDSGSIPGAVKGGMAAPLPSTVTDGSVKVDVPADSKGVASVSIPAADLLKAAGSAKESLLIQVAPSSGAKEVKLSLPAKELLQAAGGTVKTTVLDAGMAKVSLDAGLLGKALKNGGADLQLAVAKVDASLLSDSVLSKVGDGTVYDFSLSVDGSPVNGFGGGVKVQIPYTLRAGENPDKVVIYYLDDKGKLQTVKNGQYQAASGAVEFKPPHFSRYVAAYNEVTFKDLDQAAWAKSSIEVMAARDIVNGTGDGSFQPLNQVTRAEFLKMLMSALELTDDAAKSSLTDVEQGSWYASSVAAAHKLGIVKGKEDGSFGVEDPITREDMAVMVFRAAQATGRGLTANAASGEAFRDENEIASYAVQAVDAMRDSGIIEGVGTGRFAPKSPANRAQAAVIVSRLFKQAK